jgi:hypothetical protein
MLLLPVTTLLIKASIPLRVIIFLSTPTYDTLHGQREVVGGRGRYSACSQGRFGEESHPPASAADASRFVFLQVCRESASSSIAAATMVAATNGMNGEGSGAA